MKKTLLSALALLMNKLVWFHSEKRLRISFLDLQIAVWRCVWAESFWGTRIGLKWGTPVVFLKKASENSIEPTGMQDLFNWESGFSIKDLKQQNLTQFKNF